MPPSTANTVPVVDADRGDARYAIASATSSALTIRPDRLTRPRVAEVLDLLADRHLVFDVCAESESLRPAVDSGPAALGRGMSR